MGKEAKSEMMGKVYREFSRQKYNKYKAQFPKLRQSQIVSKIIKEWDALDHAAKENLQKIYERKNYLTNQDISSSEQLARHELTSKEQRRNVEMNVRKAPKNSFKSTKIHQIVKSYDKEGSDFNRGSEQKDDSRLGQSSSPQVVVKRKLIGKKQSQSEYVHFFKQHYNRLKAQHKRWTTNQISSVIKLLWKRSKKANKTLRRKDGQLRTSKPLSGKRYFRKVRALSNADTVYLWKRMPIETRGHWENESRGVEINNLSNYNSYHFGKPDNSKLIDLLNK